jgi:gluconokinase
MTPPAPDAPRILAVDVGTSSVRAQVFDARARAGAGARRTYSIRTTPDGGGEVDAPFLAGLVEEVLDEVLARDPGPYRAVACCTFWHSVLGLDGEEPRTPVYTWAETRPQPFGRALREKLEERAYHDRTGAFFHPLFLPEKILWLRSRGVAPRAWVSFGEYLYRRLFGRSTCAVSMASGTGLLDVRRCEWDGPTLEAVGVRPEQLGPLGDLSDVLAGLREPWARRWPALRDVPWLPPVGDGACNNLGSGCTGPDRVAVMLGTSGAMRVCTDASSFGIPWGVFCYRADRRRILLGGALNDGGNLVEWIRNSFRLGAHEEVEREVAAMEPDAHGLTFLPFLAGERSPGWAADARGTISGLRLSTRPAEILRAAMEAVCYRFALVHELLGAAVPGTREVVASGGGFLGSRAWTGILADVLGRPVTASGEPEASIRGVALLALESLGLVRNLDELPAALGETVRPDAGSHDRYRAAIERQRRHYELLVGPRAPADFAPAPGLRRL